jgi:hypothetical protein
VTRFRFPSPPTLDQVAAVAVGGLALAIGVLGAIESFEHVATVTGTPRVPLGIDLGIAAFTAVDLLQARHGHQTRWGRWVPWGLAVATILLNLASTDGMAQVVRAVALPSLWIALVELARHSVAHYAGLAAGPTRIERFRRARWLLAPVATFRLWRWMVLVDEPSTGTALARWQRIQLTRAGLVQEHGRAWRFKKSARRAAQEARNAEMRERTTRPAPRPTSPVAAAAAANSLAGQPLADTPAEVAEIEPAGDVGFLAAQALKLAVAAREPWPSRSAMARALRSAGHQLGNDTARQVFARYQELATESEAS